MRIVFATENRHKIEELSAILKKPQYLGDRAEDIEILTLREVGIVEDIVEDGDTFEENALIKARAAARSGYIGIGDDSGLVVRALGGAPGILSARYAGEHGNDKKNNARLLSEMQGVAERDAAFVCTIACVIPTEDGERSFVVRGECEGVIVNSERGTGGFGYDPLFYLPEHGKTFAELSADEKNSVSHRARAAAEFARRLAEEGLI